jgi:hypothetical protein
MKSAVLTLCAALALCCLPQGALAYDPTDPAQVRAAILSATCASATDKTIQPWRPAPSPDDPRADGYCWQYGSDSNYHPEAACTFSPSSCLDQCYEIEQRCADNCAAHYSGDCGTSGSACENCQDRCRQNFNTCESGC